MEICLSIVVERIFPGQEEMFQELSGACLGLDPRYPDDHALIRVTLRTGLILYCIRVSLSLEEFIGLPSILERFHTPRQVILVALLHL